MDKGGGGDTDLDEQQAQSVRISKLVFSQLHPSDSISSVSQMTLSTRRRVQAGKGRTKGERTHDEIPELANPLSDALALDVRHEDVGHLKGLLDQALEGRTVAGHASTCPWDKAVRVER